MKRRIYSHDNPLIVANARNMLELAGIAVELKNQFAGGAAGELSPIDAWPELWVQEQDLIEAQSVLASLLDLQNNKAAKGRENTQAKWQCAHCSEWNEASFEICWQCQSLPPEK